MFSSDVGLESGLGLETGLESFFSGLGLGLGLGPDGLGLGLGLGGSYSWTRAPRPPESTQIMGFFAFLIHVCYRELLH